jgi:hypothetical protein
MSDVSAHGVTPSDVRDLAGDVVPHWRQSRHDV